MQRVALLENRTGAHPQANVSINRGRNLSWDLRSIDNSMLDAARNKVMSALAWFDPMLRRVTHSFVRPTWPANLNSPFSHQVAMLTLF